MAGSSVGAMRPGVRVAVDVGSVRVGVAACDAAATMAFPVTVLARDRRTGRDVAELVALIAAREAVEVIVGLPTTLSGGDSMSTQDARDYAARLAPRIAPVSVRLYDERLTTTAAEQQLREAGHDSRSARTLIDAAAAVVLLDDALDAERNTGEAPGEEVST